MTARPRAQSTFLQSFGLALSVAFIACAPSEDANPNCSEGRCDVDDVLASRNDPIAKFLLQAGVEAGEEGAFGIMEGDYESILRGVAAVQGCSEDTIRTFVVTDDLFRGPGNGSDEVQARVDAVDCEGLTFGECEDERELACQQEGGEMGDGSRCIVTFPRIVSTVCRGSGGPKPHDFFISLPEESFESPGELETRTIEMFAWDASAKRYNFYETFPTGNEGEMALNPSPTRCQQCHLTPTDFSPDGMHMTPIMNELRRPWTHWFAGGQDSHRFFVPPRASESASYQALVEPFKATASEFEQIIRAGQTQVQNARLFAAKDNAELDWRDAMHILRPLFCSEQINYVTLRGGKVQLEALVDPSLSARLRGVGVKDFNWQAKEFLQLANSTGVIEQIPVRGNADSLLESQMVGGFLFNFLRQEQALRLHAVDWQGGPFSEVKCQVWMDAYNLWTGEPPAIEPSASSGQRISALLNRILEHFPQTADGKIFTISDASLGNVSDYLTLSDEELSALSCQPNEQGIVACMVTPEELGQLVENYVNDFEGDPLAYQRLSAIRESRVCHVVQQADLEVLPEVSAEGEISDRFDLDFQHCAADCCADASLVPGELTGISDRDECERHVELSLSTQDLNIRETETGQCATACLPSRYANRPGIPSIPESCPGPGQRIRSVSPLCLAADLVEINLCIESGCEVNDIMSRVGDSCFTCMSIERHEHGDDLPRIMLECSDAAPHIN